MLNLRYTRTNEKLIPWLFKLGCDDIHLHFTTHTINFTVCLHIHDTDSSMMFKDTFRVKNPDTAVSDALKHMTRIYIFLSIDDIKYCDE